MIKIGITLIFVLTFNLYSSKIDSCIGCHGTQFEKMALGKSKVVKNMSKENIIKAIKGYKDGSYGGDMKSLMRGQVSHLSDTDIEAIVSEIKNEKKVLTLKENLHNTDKSKTIVIDNLKYENQLFTKKYNWEEAKNYCSKMSLNNCNWRLPKKSELMKLVTKKINHGKHGQFYIRKEFIDNLKDFAWFWSITEKNKATALIVNFYNGVFNTGEKELKGYVLCVSDNITQVHLDIPKTSIENKRHLVSINGTFYINASEEECHKGIKYIPNLYLALPSKEKNMIITLGPTSLCGEIIPTDYVHSLTNFKKLTFKQKAALATLLMEGYLDTLEYKRHLEQVIKGN